MIVFHPLYNLNSRPRKWWRFARPAKGTTSIIFHFSIVVIAWNWYCYRDCPRKNSGKLKNHTKFTDNFENINRSWNFIDNSFNLIFSIQFRDRRHWWWRKKETLIPSIHAVNAKLWRSRNKMLCALFSL